MRELDIVRTLKPGRDDVDGHAVPAGVRGTIVFDHNGGEAFTVEVVQPDGHTEHLATYQAADVQLVSAS